MPADAAAGWASALAIIVAALLTAASPVVILMLKNRNVIIKSPPSQAPVIPEAAKGISSPPDNPVEGAAIALLTRMEARIQQAEATALRETEVRLLWQSYGRLAATKILALGGVPDPFPGEKGAT